MNQIIFVLKVTLVIIWIFVTSIVAIPFAPFCFFTFDLNRLFALVFWPFASFITGIRVFPVNRGAALPSQPCVFVSNHQSALDLLLFSPVVPPRMVLIGKKEIWFVPFFNLFYWAGRNIFIDRKNKAHSIAGLDQAVQYLTKLKVSIWIFPEGTRNRTEETLLPFKKGAFYMAIKAQVPIVPVTASSMRSFMNWDKKILKSGKALVKFLDPIETKGMTVDQVDDLMKKTHQVMKQEIERQTLKINLVMERA